MAISNAWRFSGNLRDFAGLRNHAAPIGGPAQYATGQHGQALVCEEGRGAYVTIPGWRYYYDVSPSRFAVECWVTSTSATHAVRTAVSKGSAWSLDLSDDDGYVRFVHGAYVVTTTADVLDGSAHHILATYDYTSTNPYVFEYRIYVDGVLVETDAGNATTFTDSQAEPVYFGCHGAGIQGADALIEDVRIWADPIHDSEVATVNYVTPVADFELGTWSMAGAGPEVADLGALDNDLTLTANGQRVNGYQGGTAVGPVSPGGGWTAEAPITVEKPIDRFSIAGYFCLARTGVQQRILELGRTGGGDPIVAFDIAPNGLPTVHAYNDDGDHWIAAQNVQAITSTSTWYNVEISIYPGAIRWRFGGRSTYSQDVAPGFYPLNAPAYSNQDTLRLDGKWQDLRLVETYVPPDEWDQWQAMPLAQTTGARLGTGKPLRMYLFDGENLIELDPIAVQGIPEEPDTTPPSVPDGLAASSVTSSGFLLSWNASVDAGEEPDTTPPDVPTGLVESGVTSTGFTIGWSASNDH